MLLKRWVDAGRHAADRDVAVTTTSARPKAQDFRQGADAIVVDLAEAVKVQRHVRGVLEVPYPLHEGLLVDVGKTSNDSDPIFLLVPRSAALEVHKGCCEHLLGAGEQGDGHANNDADDRVLANADSSGDEAQGQAALVLSPEALQILKRSHADTGDHENCGDRRLRQV